MGLTLVFAATINLSGLEPGVKIYMTQASFVVMAHITAAIVLILAIKGFRDRLRTPYLLICASILMVAMGTIQSVLLWILHAENTAYYRLGGLYIFYITVPYLAYFGLRTLAVQLLTKSVLLKAWLPISITLVFGILATLIPTPRTDLPEYRIDIEVFMNSSAFLLIIVTALVFKARRQASIIYKSAFRWLGFVYGSIALVTTSNMIAVIYLPHEHWYWMYGVSYSVYNFTAIAVMVAALRFTRIAYAADTLIKKNRSTHSLSSIDIVMALAQLASNPKSIDEILDELRRLTVSLATSGSGVVLTKEQQIITARVYTRLENFLINKEPVRKFDRKELRQMIDIRFKDAVQEPVFWQKIE